MNDNAHLQRNAVEPDDERTSSNSSDGVCEAIPAVCASEHETVATIDALVASSPDRSAGAAGPSRAVTVSPNPKKVQETKKDPSARWAHDLVMSQQRRPFVMIRSASNRSALPLKSKGMRMEIARHAFLNDQRMTAREIDEVINQMDALAEIAAPTVPVWYRVAPLEGGGVEIDVGDKEHTRIRVTAGKVEVITSGSETLFYRSHLSEPMVLPAERGDYRLLKQYLNVSDVDFVLLIGWISYTLALPKGPTAAYVIALLQGGQGTGKSWISNVLLRLLDPSAVGVQLFPSSANDLSIAGQHAHVLAYDNMRSFRQLMADVLCIASTGGAISSRSLYTDDTQHVLRLQVALILNGIHDFINQPDLAQRCLPIRTLSIDESARKSYAEMLAAFEADLPVIIRGILDLIASVLQHLPSAVVTHPERMIAFSKWLAAMELAASVPPGVYQAAYSASMREAQLDSLMQNLLASAVVQFAEELPDGTWSGTPSDLLDKLAAPIRDEQLRSREWPGNPIALSKRLNALAASLATQGIAIQFSRGKERHITITTREVAP